MRQLLDIAICVLAFYATVGIMGIGFGTMWAGARGAQAIARWFFLRPMQSSWRRATSTVMTCVGTIVTGLINLTKRAIASELRELAADARWLINRQRR